MAIKPFPCLDCDKRFSRKDALKVRLQVQLVLRQQCANLIFSVIDSSKGAAADHLQKDPGLRLVTKGHPLIAVMQSAMTENAAPG
jgi:hypothetical protein